MRSVIVKKRKRDPSIGSYGHNIDLKQWDRRFYKNRRSPQSLFIEAWREYDTSGDLLDVFLRNLGDQTSFWITEVVKKYCNNSKLRRPREQPIQARSRVCDTEIPSGIYQKHGNWLNAEQLRSVLQENCSSNDSQPNAKLRLIYVYDLDHDYILSLAQTVSWQDVDALRDAVWKHIAHETSIRVHIPLFGYPTFRLEFHLPYLILRAAPSVNEVPGSSDSAQDQDSWQDVTFLDIPPNEEGHANYSVLKAHISLVVIGSDHFNWTGYAFANTGVSDLVFDEDEEYDAADDEEEEPDLDYFPSDGLGEVVLADSTIQDPRQYWLRVVGLRLIIILREWEYLVHKVEDCVRDWEAKHRVALSGGRSDTGQMDIKALLDRIVRTKQFLARLCELLTVSVKAWEAFAAPGGDRSYFHDISDHTARLMLNSIRESFLRLAALHQRTYSLFQSCKGSESILGRYMELESNRLNFESNQLNFESNDLNRRAHDLNLRTSNLNHEIHTFTRTSTEAAVENVKAAIETSRTTRDNIQLLWITTPFILVLQYFGADRDIFSFERNEKTFIVCIIFLWLTLPLLTCVLNFIDRAKKAIGAKVGNILGRNTQPTVPIDTV